MAENSSFNPFSVSLLLFTPHLVKLFFCFNSLFYSRRFIVKFSILVKFFKEFDKHPKLSSVSNFKELMYRFVLTKGPQLQISQ